MREYTHFISLGTVCHTARMMQRIHVKKQSYPFDWVFPTENTLIDILEDDFDKFIDKSFYGDVEHKLSERSCRHSLYHEDFFFHKNPRNDDDYEYYKRCIDRFRIVMKDGAQKLFVLMHCPQSTKHPKDVYKMIEDGMSKSEIIEKLKERAQRLNETIAKHTNNYRLLVVMNFGDNAEQSFVMEHQGNIHFLTLNTLSQSTGVTFKNNSDNLYFSGLMCEHYLR